MPADTPFTTRQSQILAKVETVSGSYEALTASEGGCRVHVSPEVSLDMPLEDRPIARSSMTALGKLITTQAMGISFRTAVNTPDTVTSTLETKPFLEASSHTIVDMDGISIGVIAGGPFQRGETVTDDTGYTGRVLRNAVTGDSFLYYEGTTTQLTTAEELTGGTSGATTTSQAAGAVYGHIIKPISDNQKTISMRKQEDGNYWAIAGAMSKLTFTAENSKPCYFDFAFMGPYYAHGAEAMTTGITYNTEKPPKFQGSVFSIDGVSTIVPKSVNFDANGDPVKREDANTATTGIIAMYKADRGDGPKLTVNLELPAIGSLDILADMRGETAVKIAFNVGTTAGKSFAFFADYAQVESITYSDSDGIRTIDVTYVLTGAANSGDDEYEMIMY